jgi:hypothetical protein
MCSVTSQGHPHGRFERAVRTGNSRIAEDAARELGWLTLPDALSLCLLYRDDPERYERAAARWLARFVHDQQAVRLQEVELLAVLLRLAAGAESTGALDTLEAILTARGIRVNRWRNPLH